MFIFYPQEVKSRKSHLFFNPKINLKTYFIKKINDKILELHWFIKY